jgi:seryl-tRNA synthetase
MSGVPEAASEELAGRQIALRHDMVEAGLLVPSGVDGLYGRDRRFESTLHAVDRLGREAGLVDNPRELSFPPFIPRPTFDRIAYLRNFPQLSGLVSSFLGDSRDHLGLLAALDADAPYDDALELTDLCLTPACCYPIYPSLAGTLGPDGEMITVVGHCFRHEPSPDPMRMQSFRMREHVRLGEPEVVEEWRDKWVDRARDFFSRLEIPMSVDVASDAFFGRTGRLLARSQRELELKLEFVVPVYGEDHATACASVNLHREHFGELFGIKTPDGNVAHSSCFGFGLERVTVALFAFHGLDSDAWPSSVREVLGRS